MRGPGAVAARLGALAAARRWHLALACLAAGLALAATVPGKALPSAALLAAALPALALAAVRRPGLALVAAGLVLVGAALGSARLARIDAPGAAIRPSEQLTARATALGRPRPGRFGSSVELRLTSGRHRGARVLAVVPRWTRWPAAPGAEVVVRGELRALRGGYGAWLRRRGIAAGLALASVRLTGVRRGGLAGAVDRLRARSERAVDAGLGRADGALLRGMVLGEDEEVAEPVRDDFRASGLAHLLAVSGQNVMLLAALALPALVVLGLGPAGRAVALLGLIALYVPLAGAGPSLQRAGVMGAAGVMALAASRPASRSYGLALAAAVTLLVNPRACADPGWQLSFAAVAGILWLAPPVGGALVRLRGEGRAAGASTSRLTRAAARERALRLASEGAALTLAATLATAPLLAYHFGSVPLASLPANLAALPVVAPIMWLGMLKAALGQLAPLLPGAGGLAAALGVAARPLIGWLEAVAERAAELPGARLRLPVGSVAGVLVAYALLAAAALAAARAGGRLGPRAEEAAAWWRRRPRAHRAAMLAAATAAAILVTARLLAGPEPPRDLTVRFLDVGQGDATLVQDPSGAAVLFDGGPPEAHVVRLLRGAGVRRLSLVVATHQSRDHHGGLASVLERFPVGLLLDGGDGTRDSTFRALEAEADRRGVRRVPARAPMTLQAGGLAIRVLSPPPRPPGPPPDDPNPRAVVALVSEGGFDLLLSADAESEALLPLELPRVEAMKVPHHGSSDPGLPQLLERLRPEVAAVEVGRHNPYGHPAPSTLATLRRAGVRTWRTDRDGTVTLTVRGRRMEVDGDR
jgi:competence protein ComEC